MGAPALFIRFFIRPRISTFAGAINQELPKALLFLALGLVVIWALSYRYGPDLFPFSTTLWWGGTALAFVFLSLARRKALPPANRLFFHRAPTHFPKSWAILVHLWRTSGLVGLGIGGGIWYGILHNEILWGVLGSMGLLILWVILAFMSPFITGSGIEVHQKPSPGTKPRSGWLRWTLKTYLGNTVVLTTLVYGGLFFVLSDQILMSRGPQLFAYAIFLTILQVFITSPLGQTYGLKTWLFLRIHHVSFLAPFLPLALTLMILSLPGFGLLILFAPGWHVVLLGSAGLVYFPLVTWGINWWITRKYPLIGALASMGSAALFAWAVFTQEILPLAGLIVLPILAWTRGRNVYLNHEVEDHVES